MKRLARFIGVALGLIHLAPGAALACSVCYGDPNSLQVQGAEAGVLFLMGVIATVLLSIAGMILFWSIRAKRITREINIPALSSLS